MKEKINEILILLKDYDQKKINDFLSTLSEMELSDENKLQGLLYYCLKFNKITIQQIEEDFDSKTYETVSTLIKLDKINYDQQIEEAEKLRKMFFAITKDIRTIMMKIAFTVAELRNSDNLLQDDKQKLANSILCLFAPLSARLGLSGYKTELENGAFKISEPDLYNQIQDEVDNRFHKRQPIVERLTALVENCLKDLNIKGKVYGRKKHIYSIYKKLQTHTLDNMYDLIAVRAIVSTVADCYALLGRLHSIVEPFKNRFKDYISTPKANGYQSLHTTVTFEGFPVEIQIRTTEMHQYAEYGIAAHWLYKEKSNKQDNLDVRLAWLRQMMENEETSIDELASSLSQDIYNNDIFVQSPKGKVFYLPAQSTPIDFAYAVHSEVGNKCVGAKVNGKIVQTNSELHNGDIVEIITNPNAKGPSRDWLKICKTAEARNKINHFFKKTMRDETIKLGKSMLENAIKEKGYSVNKLMSEKSINEMLEYYNLNEIDDFYLNIGTNSISAKLISNKLAQAYKKQIQKEIVSTPQTNNISLFTPSDKLINLKDLNNVLLKFANCCHPVYGDDIVGFVSAGRGVIIHRAVCPNVSYFSKTRLIDASWKTIEKQEKKK